MRTDPPSVFGRIKTGFVAAALLMLGGCAGTPITQQLSKAPPSDLPVRVELAQTPFFPQTQNFCGPASMAALLNGTGLKVTPDEIAQQIYTPGREGTLQSEILTGARRHDRLPITINGMLAALHEVAAGNPVLVFENLSLAIYPIWHYAILVGYDLHDGTAILRSGTTKREIMNLSTLEHTWGRTGFWGVVIAAPQGPVPQTAQISEWMSEAVLLERMERYDAVLQAYTTAATHWPKQAAPLISLANLHLAPSDQMVADPIAAEGLLRRALPLAQGETRTIVLNNLADTLMTLKKWPEAEAFARQAVGAGDRFQPIAQQTLDEILAAKPQTAH